MSLDLSALVAGAKFKGEFEERLKGVLKDVTDAAGEVRLRLVVDYQFFPCFCVN